MNKKRFMILEWLLLLALSLTPVVFADIIIISDPNDLAPPDLVDFSITPVAIDTGTGPQTVTFTLRITDDLAGFAYGTF